VEAWRRRGYASAAAHVLMGSMRARGKRAVWAAFESNTASLQLAARLGFTPVARVVSLFREGSER
jgi:RimJ/RimL family protein N-acetyltransferase